MSRGKNLAKNTIIYFIGTFGSKLLSFLLLPLYANYLTQSAYGEYDLIHTIIQLAYPVITLMLDNAMYTFLINPDKYKIDEIVSFALRVFLINTAVAISICAIVSHFCTIKYFPWIITWMISVSFYNLMIQICRGCNKPTVYSASGVILTAVTLIGNITGIVILKLDYISLIVSNIVAHLGTSFFLEYKFHTLRLIRTKITTPGLKRKLLIYSIPLIPNTISWWVINVSDRFMITYFMNSAANGVYAMAGKIPAVLNVIHSIFSLAWADDIMTSFSLEESTNYANAIYNKYITAIIGITTILICGNRLIFEYIIGGNFVEAYQYTYFLYLGCVFSALASCLGAFYGYHKKSINISIGSAAAALVNIIVNFFFIPLLGIQAASISTCLGFLIMWIIRLIGLKDIVKIRITFFNKLLCLVFIPLYFVIYVDGMVWNLLLILVGTVFALLTNYKVVKEIIDFGKLTFLHKGN